jgi:hypothetical protein
MQLQSVELSAFLNHEVTHISLIKQITCVTVEIREMKEES